MQKIENDVQVGRSHKTHIWQEKKKKKDLEFVKLKPIYNVYIKYSQIWEMSSIFEMSTGNSRD